MGIKQLYNDNLRKLPNEYGDVSVMSCLRSLIWLSAQYNVHITARYICGVSNTVADAASRVHEPNMLAQVLSYTIPYPLQFHMTQNSWLYLFGNALG